MSDAPPALEEETPAPPDDHRPQISILLIITMLLLIGAAWLLAGLLVPFVLALVLAIALSPVANKLERAGVPKTGASLFCLLFLIATLATGAGLVLYQAGSLLSDSERYIKRFSELLTSASQKTGADEVFETLEADTPEKKTSNQTNNEQQRTENESVVSPAKADERGDVKSGNSSDHKKRWFQFIQQGLRQSGDWLVSGLGGLLGLFGNTVVFLAYFFYMMETRREWVERITEMLRQIGLRPTRAHLVKVQEEIVAYFGCIAIVAAAYVVLVSVVLWAIGVPQFLLWGALAGVMEFIPYFGPIVAGGAPIIVALSLEHWWQPVLVAGFYLLLNFLESYVVTPLFYGQAVRFNPVTILFGALFFGWIWGPVGLMLSIPVMILLRGLLVITPDTPALDALAEVVEEEEPNA